MIWYPIDRRQILPVFLLAAGVFPLAAAGAIGGMQWPEFTSSTWEPFLPLFGAACLSGGMGLSWWRYRAAKTEKRLHAALDAYAEREIARDRRWKSLHRPWTFSTAMDISTPGQGKRTYSRRNQHARPQSQNW